VKGRNAGAALALAEKLLSSGPAASSSLPAEIEGANLVLISVPGEFAAAEARRALERGLNVMMFSDNVPVKDEVALKELAAGKGLLMKGPDCGTALIGGVRSRSPMPCRAATSASFPPRAPDCRKSPRCSRAWARACRTASASAAATCRGRRRPA
jgi:hypothetical protein